MPAAPHSSCLRDDMVEQVMRATDDESLLWPFLDAPAASRAAHAALGRLLSAVPVRLVAGCPLLAWLTGTALDPHWRDYCPPASRSLWADLEFLRLLFADAAAAGAVDGLPAGDAYAELEAFRAFADAELGVGR